MKKYLLFAHGGSFNRGCEAIVKTTSKMIKDLSVNNSTTLITYSKEEDTYLDNIDLIVDGNPIFLKKFSKDYILSYFANRALKNDSYSIGKMYQRVLDEMKRAEICISVGGDNYCYGEQPILYELDRRIKKYGKKLVLWGCSIGEEDFSQNKKEDLRNFDLIVARESLTFDLLSENLKNSDTRIKLFPDPAFTLEKHETDISKNIKENETIGINLSPLVAKRNNKILKATLGLINYILRNTNYSIALIPHVIKSFDNDYILLKDIHKEVNQYGKRVSLIGDSYNSCQLKDIISNTKIFIGARTHATIAAYSNNIPTMVLGYSVKSRGIAKDIFGEEKFVINANKVDEDKHLIKEFLELKEQYTDIKNFLENKIPSIIKKSREAANELNFK